MRLFSAAFVIPLALLGCSDGLKKFPTAKVTGKVLCDGQPVPGAYVSFGPMASGKSATAGKQAVATAGQDGMFVLSTYGAQDGAVVGKHSVRISTPHPEDFPNFTCNCETDGRKILQEVEVTAGGENNFTITLPPKTAKSRPTIDADTREDIEKVMEEERAEQNRALEKKPE